MPGPYMTAPESVVQGRFGTWQYDVVVHNPGPESMIITDVQWHVRRRDGRPPLHALGQLSGNPDPAMFFTGTNGGQVAPGQSARGRAAHFSHWEEPLVDWRISYTYPGSGEKRQLTAQVVLEPQPLSVFEYAPGRQAVLAEPDGPGPFPALLILHPYGGSARAMGWAATEAANSGWIGMAISQPGFGGSSGPWDYAGPASVKAVMEAIEFLHDHSRVDGELVAVWGISLGAMLGGLVAARSSEIAAAVLQAGIYDLEYHYRQGGLEWLEREGIAASPGDASWRDERNVMSHAHQIQCPVLLLHGAQDRIAPVEHAYRLYTLMKGMGKTTELVVLDQFGHGLPPFRIWSRHLAPFLNQVFAGVTGSQR